MLKINDVAVIYRSYVHEENIPFSSYRDGDVCIILDVYEGGTESWSGRDVGESYKVLNERTGETIHLDSTVWLKPYSEMFNNSYKRKSEEELKESRKKAFMEWVEAEKQALYESKLLGDDVLIKLCIEDIRELEKGFEEDKYTEKYFKSKMNKLLKEFNSHSNYMNEVQEEYKNNLLNKYSDLI